jgi:hypothetical protein
MIGLIGCYLHPCVAVAIPLGAEPLQNTVLLPAENVVSKRAFAQFLVMRFALPTQWVSTFPLFADVELTDPDFANLDTVYRYHLLFPNDEGYFNPNEPTTQLDAWLALGKVLFPNKKLTPAQLNAVLPEITGQEQLAGYQKPRIAMLYLAGILSVEKGDIPLQPQKPITQAWLNAMVNTLEATKLLLAEKAQNNITDELEDSTTDTTPTVPPKTYLTITPSQAIIGKQLALNDTLYFQLKEPIPIKLKNGKTAILPARSSVQGKVTNHKPLVGMGDAVERFTVELQWVRSAEDEQLYKINSKLLFQLSTLEPRRSFNAVTRGYLVSGQDVFIIVAE